MSWNCKDIAKISSSVVLECSTVSNSSLKSTEFAKIMQSNYVNAPTPIPDSHKSMTTFPL